MNTLELERKFVEKGKEIFSLEEILSIVREHGMNKVMKFEDMTLDITNSQVIFDDGRKIDIQRRQFALLVYLAERAGKFCSRDEILNDVWGDVVVENRTVDVHITGLRIHLGWNTFKTKRGKGYMFSYGTKIR